MNVQAQWLCSAGPFKSLRTVRSTQHVPKQNHMIQLTSPMCGRRHPSSRSPQFLPFLQLLSYAELQLSVPVSSALHTAGMQCLCLLSHIALVTCCLCSRQTQPPLPHARHQLSVCAVYPLNLARIRCACIHAALQPFTGCSEAAFCCAACGRQRGCFTELLLQAQRCICSNLPCEGGQHDVRGLREHLQPWQ